VSVLVLVVTSGVLFHQWRRSIFYTGEPVVTEQKIVQKLYQLMKDVHEVFQAHDIPYWIDWGTLLGAVRHQGLIPWDDDLDLSVELKDEEKLKTLGQIFQKLGYGFIPTVIGYKIFYLDGEKLNYKNEDSRFPFCDIFLRERKNGKIYYVSRHKRKHLVWGHRDGDEIFVTDQEVYPVKEYRFGELTLHGPQDPLPYFNAIFGNDWNEIAYQTINHRGRLARKVKKTLTDHDRKPALPTEPLLDRVTTVAG